MSKRKKSNISLSDRIQNSDVDMSANISDEEIDLTNDDYDVELETISDNEENQNKETSNNIEKTILKNDNKGKNKYTSLSDEELSDNEFLIFEALEIREILSLQEVSEILHLKNVHKIVKSLIEKRAIIVEEDLKRKYREGK